MKKQYIIVFCAWIGINGIMQVHTFQHSSINRDCKFLSLSLTFTLWESYSLHFKRTRAPNGGKKSSALVIISKKSFLFFPFDKKVTFSEKLIIREVCSRILRKHLIFSKLSWFLVQKIMKEGYITSSFGYIHAAPRWL